MTDQNTDAAPKDRDVAIDVRQKDRDLANDVRDVEQQLIAIQAAHEATRNYCDQSVKTVMERVEELKRDIANKIGDRDMEGLFPQNLNLLSRQGEKLEERLNAGLDGINQLHELCKQLQSSLTAESVRIQEHGSEISDLRAELFGDDDADTVRLRLLLQSQKEAHDSLVKSAEDVKVELFGDPDRGRDGALNTIRKLQLLLTQGQVVYRIITGSVGFGLLITGWLWQSNVEGKFEAQQRQIDQQESRKAEFSKEFEAFRIKAAEDISALKAKSE